jgi:hypothetical protein
VHQDDEKRERVKHKQTNQPKPENQKENCCYNQSQHHHQECCCREEKREMKYLKKKKTNILSWVLSKRMNAQMGFAKILHPDCSKFSNRNPFLSHEQP